jgi:hypothetical protein
MVACLLYVANALAQYWNIVKLRILMSCMVNPDSSFRSVTLN